ncbi:DUF6261 family protein [Aerococcaceae bacterium NML191292]|nr:DUF6261 family protein [Aerococcaceae bacterium NML191292]
MTDTLLKLPAGYLHAEEKSQIVARLVTEVESSKVKLTDEDVKRLFTRLKSKLTAFQSAKLSSRKSKHTALLKEADKTRDIDIKALYAGIRTYRSSTRPQEQQAYRNLYYLCEPYKKMLTTNYEQETAMIAKLLTQLKSEKYQADITALSLTKLVTNLTESQKQFEALFTTRVKEELNKEPVNYYTLCNELFEEYKRFCQLIDALAWAKGSDTYQKLLAIINNGRKYTADTVARRTGRLKKRSTTTKEKAPEAKSEGGSTSTEESEPILPPAESELLTPNETTTETTTLNGETAET